MHAIIFDIDGTLLKSYGIDGELYESAIRTVLGSVTFRDSWGDYTHVTDDGILEEVLSDNNLELKSSIKSKVQSAFFELLKKHIASYGGFSEIPGARHFVKTLQLAGVPIAYATGGWGASAKMKLQSAGFPISGVPLASSDDSKLRVNIMRLALQQLGSAIENITYFGDGEWDRMATQELGWNFQAVGEAIGGITHYPENVSNDILWHD